MLGFVLIEMFQSLSLSLSQTANKEADVKKQSQGSDSEARHFLGKAFHVFMLLGTPVVPFCPFSFGVSLLKLNSRKRVP